MPVSSNERSSSKVAPRKKLIEVSIPLEAINKESAREKSIRHGHPSTLHLWWARRPLAACRAVLFAQLVDDPSACPEEFPTVELQNAERDRLHKLIERLVPWEASNNEMILTEARYEIARSVARGRGEKLPPLAQMKPQAIIDYLQDQRAAGLRPVLGRRLDPARSAAARPQGHGIGPQPRGRVDRQGADRVSAEVRRPQAGKPRSERAAPVEGRAGARRRRALLRPLDARTRPRRRSATSIPR